MGIAGKNSSVRLWVKRLSIFGAACLLASCVGITDDFAEKISEEKAEIEANNNPGVLFSIAAGEYNSDQTLALTAKRSGVTICYTSDGSQPACTNGVCVNNTNPYTTPLIMHSNQIINAISCKTAASNSPVNSAAYIIDKQAPVLSGTVTASEISSSSVQLSWPAVTDAGGASSVTIEICYDTNNSDCAANFTAKATVTTGNPATLTGLSKGITYYALLQAKDSAGNISGQLSQSFVPTGLWSHQAYLKATNAEGSEYPMQEEQLGDLFGTAVSISDDTIVAGASQEDSAQKEITNGTSASSNNNATNSGAAYVFVRSGTTWSQQAYLKAPNAEGADQFGNAVAVSGDTIVVGASKEDSAQKEITNGTTANADNTETFAGAAYVFVRE